MTTKNGTKKKIDELTRDELIEMVKTLKKRKKYGLIWESKPEDVISQCRLELPVLEEVKERAIEDAPDQPTNLIIEGDNYHALSVLNYTHAGKVDLIYIDPPYNTGAKDWKYNNDYVDINDTFRHSKWLSMMHNRLRLAKGLLSKRGVLICTIDHNEQENLGILLRELFPECEITCVTIIHNPAGVQGINFSYTHEFAYFVYPAKGKYISDATRENDLVSPLRDWGTISKREQAKNCFFPIIIKGDSIVGFGEVCANDFHPKSANEKKSDGTLYVYPIDSNGVERKWVFSRPSIEEILGELFVKKLKGQFIIMRRKTHTLRRTVWDDKRYYANIYGSKLLNKIIDIKFPFPKSLYAVEDCIKSVIHDKETAVILDFFAGSGTTGHAVLNLNQQDVGSRQFILCTNNENNIAEDITYARIKKVIEGYGDEQGIPANFRYFKTTFVPRDEASDDTRRRLVKRCAEMLCVKEDCFKKLTDKKEYKIFTNGKTATGILFDLDSIEEFKAKIGASNLPAHLYIFSLTDDVFSEEFEDLSVEYTLCPIPESILEVYRRLCD